ncbi:XPG domain containing-domain-containing protein [Aspergillus filifer]
MGIPRLRRHLLPFSQSVLLQGNAGPDHEALECINSVVIDGPSLVYNVYSRLLSWFSSRAIGVLDSLPTCDEVSRGVMLYLIHLEMLGVKIEGIYFDGALPVSKREIRMARLESQRERLKYFCARTKNGFKKSRSCNCQRIVGPENILRSRPTPANYVNVPANAFMVSAVFEDLKFRWSWKRISSATDEILPLPSSELGTYPWEGITSMVPGEADVHCAYTARVKNSSILTNDSDLLLYDLGGHGSVIFLDSVELTKWDPRQPLLFQIKAVLMRPSVVARRLDIPNLRYLACELEAHPNTGLSKLIQRSKSAATMIKMHDHHHYHRFAVAYEIDQRQVVADESNQGPGYLDNRISELFWQYELRAKYAAGDYPHVYLPILNEDHTKQCAWAKGRELRQLAYSILNNSRPPEQRHRYICEFVRRGHRIAEDRVELYPETWISARMRALDGRLGVLRITLQDVDDAQVFWTIFALGHCYGADAEFAQNDLGKLKQFLTLGYMGKQLAWADIHLTAQMHAVLYSLRVLKQLLALSSLEDLTANNLMVVLTNLPPLHNIKPACQCVDLDFTFAQLSKSFERVPQGSQLRESESAAEVVQGSPHDFKRHHVKGTVPSLGSNIYELLQG